MERVPLPFEANSFDCVLGSHIFEHITNLVPLVEDIHRILKPGGHLIAVTPYGSSDNAWDNPQHVRGFTEHTWLYFDQGMYVGDNAGNGATEGYRGDFTVVQTMLVPCPEFATDPEIEFKKRHWRNVIQEIHAVLRKK
jgi:SAM-dependent methyltransferase